MPCKSAPDTVFYPAGWRLWRKEYVVPRIPDSGNMLRADTAAAADQSSALPYPAADPTQIVGRVKIVPDARNTGIGFVRRRLGHKGIGIDAQFRVRRGRRS